eukprot:CAMPEP_0184697886 /NCGR_PEP_ID=MMETSP0313-20130426/4682_1 /TAXON_ID=2792 /ORGANISM="Porphyridium aerugineum, Strain SAG 1380-2" /LENGTH=1334 /DNA_ID=CAMNT_0027156729 /DNA_START=101 /DNA_END=4105 /DNA_ORIENTATION=+
MGVPAFFRWLSLRYPKILDDCIEQMIIAEDGTDIQIDPTQPNPNNIEFDNLYLDMNGIIHPCTHPEDRPAPQTEEDMYVEIMRYIDRIMYMIRPRKLVHMAIDGVAPRAKINQQRSRRFKSAQEMVVEFQEEQKLKKEWKANGVDFGDDSDDDYKDDLVDEFDESDKDSDENSKDEKKKTKKQKSSSSSAPSKRPFDRNVITPGTPFMENLAKALRKHVAEKIQNDPLWKNLKIIVSDSSVPGEGEHKIAQFIRQSRLEPGYNPNLRHVMYGLDADLIMLGLATHEVSFTILREIVLDKHKHSHIESDVDKKGFRASADAKKYAMKMANGRSVNVIEGTVDKLGGKKPFQLLHLNVLREYLDFEFRDAMVQVSQTAVRQAGRSGRVSLSASADEMAKVQGDLQGYAEVASQFEFDIEKVVDDFVFLCFFVGNDFLPHLPSLDIREGGIDFLIELYKKLVPRIGYITDGHGEPDLDKARIFLREISAKEDDVFRARLKAEQNHAAFMEGKKSGKPPSASYEKDEKAAAKPAERMPLPPKKSGPVSSVFELEQELFGNPNSMNTKNEDEELVALGRRNPPAKGKKAQNVSSKRKEPSASEPAVSSEGKNEVSSSVELGAEPDVKNLKKPRLSEEPKKESRPVASSDDVSPPDATEITEEILNKAITGMASESSSSDEESSSSSSKETSAEPSKTKEMTAEMKAKHSKFKDEMKERLTKINTIENPVDDVRLHEAGWKERYFESKMHWKPTENDFQTKKVNFARSYFEGLIWVMRYYYKGCVSWTWYYPYHYAPFASDLVECDIQASDIVFEQGECFRPLEQLMSVLPAYSARGVLPDAFAKLMRSSKSPIVDFYPEDFEVDLNGKKFAWQGVVLLPFVDADRLRKALEPLYYKLTPEELKRNEFGKDLVFAFADSPLGRKMLDMRAKAKRENRSEECMIELDESAGVLFGKLESLNYEVDADLEILESRFPYSVSAYHFLNPVKPHLCRLLPNATPLAAVLTDAERAETNSGQLGWKAAKFGALGHAARHLMIERNKGEGGGRGFRGGNGMGFGSDGSNGNRGGGRRDRDRDRDRDGYRGGSGNSSGSGWGAQPYQPAAAPTPPTLRVSGTFSNPISGAPGAATAYNPYGMYDGGSMNPSAVNYNPYANQMQFNPYQQQQQQQQPGVGTNISGSMDAASYYTYYQQLLQAQQQATATANANPYSQHTPSQSQANPSNPTANRGRGLAGPSADAMRKSMGTGAGVGAGVGAGTTPFGTNTMQPSQNPYQQQQMSYGQPPYGQQQQGYGYGQGQGQGQGQGRGQLSGLGGAAHAIFQDPSKHRGRGSGTAGQRGHRGR